MNLSAAILIGHSTRMGCDKALLKLKHQTFLGRLAEELAGCSELFISCAAAGDYSDCGLEVLVDEHLNIGPIEGIRHALSHASSDYVFICSVDTPFVKREMMLYLAEFISSDYDCYVFRDKDRIHPLCGIYKRAVLPAVLEQIAEGNYRMMRLLTRVRTKYVDIGTSCFDPRALLNINTPADYQALFRPAVFCVSGVKNSGKTHLVERLIHAFTDRGLSVGVIKHDGHSFECDVPGTDSDRFYRAGALATAVFSASQSFVRVRREMSVDEMIRQMGDVDVVIIEGMKHSSYPKVEVIRSGISGRSICDSASLLCIATDTSDAGHPNDTQAFEISAAGLFENAGSSADIAPSGSRVCPVYHLDDTEGIFRCIMAGLSIRPE